MHEIDIAELDQTRWQADAIANGNQFAILEAVIGVSGSLITGQFPSVAQVIFGGGGGGKQLAPVGHSGVSGSGGGGGQLLEPVGHCGTIGRAVVII